GSRCRTSGRRPPHFYSAVPTRPVITPTQVATRSSSSGKSGGMGKRRETLPPVKRVLPPARDATSTLRGCLRAGPMGWPVAASQSRAVLSQPPVARVNSWVEGVSSRKLSEERDLRTRVVLLILEPRLVGGSAGPRRASV